MHKRKAKQHGFSKELSIDIFECNYMKELIYGNIKTLVGFFPK